MASSRIPQGVPLREVPDFIRRTADLALDTGPRTALAQYLAWLEMEAKQVRLMLGWSDEVVVNGESKVFSPTYASVNAFFSKAPPPSSRAAAVLVAAGMEAH